MICAARNEASGFRAESGAEGRERREDGADDRCPTHQLGSLCLGRGVRRPWHSLPRRSRIRKALRKPRFPLRWVHRRRCIRLRPGKRERQRTLPSKAQKLPLGSGGALVGSRSLTMEELQATLADLDKITDQRVDLMTLMESRLFDQKIKKLMLPTQQPVVGGILGSSFGWRIDPLNGHSALHTGLDFPASNGTPILAAAGGVVVAQEYHPAYGNMVEIDHGNDLVTRYAHASSVLVKKGDLVKRGQKIAEVGSTGRSTGSHLHFEVLVQGVFQDPQKFLTAGQNLPAIVGQMQRQR